MIPNNWFAILRLKNTGLTCNTSHYCDIHNNYVAFFLKNNYDYIERKFIWYIGHRYIYDIILLQDSK